MDVNFRGPDGRAMTIDEIGIGLCPVGEFIRAAIKRKGETNKGVAKRAGMTLSDLEAILNGERPITIEDCAKLSIVFPETQQELMRIQELGEMLDATGSLADQLPDFPKLLPPRPDRKHEKKLG